ncbi:InsA-like protein [Klebsiella oxytoca]|uniref:InsA-like protein n=1 Tax=Klebsiella oxytoca TaxID=571 RepID=A0A318FPW1_KLEOX|nr:InsA-like protein [Klebsiella oxytoca]
MVINVPTDMSLNHKIHIPLFGEVFYINRENSSMANSEIVCPRCHQANCVTNNGHSASGVQRYRCKYCRKTFQLDFRYNASKPGIRQAIVDMATQGTGCRATARSLHIGLNTVLRHLKNAPHSDDAES